MTDRDRQAPDRERRRAMAARDADVLASLPRTADDLDGLAEHAAQTVFDDLH